MTSILPLRAGLLLVVSLVVAIGPASAQGDAARGARAYQSCVQCHALEPGRHLSGPSLAGIVGKKAGTVEGFDRYSPALKAADLVWDAPTLDAWLAAPAALVPGNRMTALVPDASTRADLVAYLGALAEGEAAARAAGLAIPRPSTVDLKTLGPASRVFGITHCRDTYRLTMQNGVTLDFWERNLRFKTDTGPDGPRPGEPTLVTGGSQGDRAQLVFAGPQEISASIEPGC